MAEPGGASRLRDRVLLSDAGRRGDVDRQVEAAQLLPGDVLVSRSNTRERVGLAGVYGGLWLFRRQELRFAKLV